MATKKTRDQVQALSKAELERDVLEVRRKLNQSLLKRRLGQLADVAEIWRLRKNSARLQARLSDLVTGAKGGQ